MALDIKDIIKIARAQFQELVPELSLESADIRLEEIERQGRNWALTFSVPNSTTVPLRSLMGGGPPPSVMAGALKASQPSWSRPVTNGDSEHKLDQVPIQKREGHLEAVRQSLSLLRLEVRGKRRSQQRSPAHRLLS